MRHIRSISKKKHNYKSILFYIQKSTASNINLPSVEITCKEMIVNGITDKVLKNLISASCESDVILDDNVDFVTSDKSNPESPLRAPIQNQLNTPVIETTPVITSQKTPNLPSLFKSIRDPSSVVIQDSTFTDSKISNGIHEINRKKANPTYKSEQIMTTNKSKPKSMPTKNSVIVVGDSIVKHLTGPGISKKNHIKIKTNPGATTENIIDYIKPNIRKKPDFLLVHCGTNDLTNGINIMTKIRKVVATVEEMDKIKLGFTSIICRKDVDKTDEITAVNDRLQKYCLSKGLLFVDNSNIDASYLNRGKLHLNRQGTSVLADNFRKSFVTSR